jgi:hypothetical protein
MSLQSLGLSAESLRGIGDLSGREAAPAQAPTIPLILEDHDARTGDQAETGKTREFAANTKCRQGDGGAGRDLPLGRPVFDKSLGRVQKDL